MPPGIGEASGDNEGFAVDPGYVGPWVNSKDIVLGSSCKVPCKQLPQGLPVPSLMWPGSVWASQMSCISCSRTACTSSSVIWLDYYLLGPQPLNPTIDPASFFEYYSVSRLNFWDPAEHETQNIIPINIWHSDFFTRDWTYGCMHNRQAIYH